jgi:23S rRNA pseudouridine2604 synthase
MTWRRRYEGEPQRINKWLASEGVCSRREAEALIAEGRVRIDGALVADPGRKIEAGQQIEVDNGAAAPPASYVLNKPVGFVSAQPEGDQVPAARLLTGANMVGESTPPSPRASLAPLGRLDQDSRGLLLLSEDGVLAKAVIGPQSLLEKEYLVRVRGEFNANKLKLLRHGLTLDGRVLKRAKVDETAPGVLRFVLSEGRKRQIRRMCTLVDLDVLDLKRVRIGPLKLGSLSEGKWRALTREERAALIKASRPV